MNFGLLKIASDGNHLAQLMDRHRADYDRTIETADHLDEASNAYGEHVGTPEKIMRGAVTLGAPILGGVGGFKLGAKAARNSGRDYDVLGSALGTGAGIAGGIMGQKAIRSAYDRGDEQRVPLRNARENASTEYINSLTPFGNSYEDAQHASQEDPTAFRAIASQDHPADARLLDELRGHLRNKRMQSEEDRGLNNDVMRSTRDLNRAQLNQMNQGDQ